METVRFCMFTTWTGSRLRSRPMSASLSRDENVIRFLTDVRQHKDEEVRDFPQVCLAFADSSNQKYVSISGHAQITNDRKMVKSLWSLPAKAWWQDADDPNIRVITVNPEDGGLHGCAGTVQWLADRFAGTSKPTDCSARFSKREVFAFRRQAARQ